MIPVSVLVFSVLVQYMKMSVTCYVDCKMEQFLRLREEKSRRSSDFRREYLSIHVVRTALEIRWSWRS